ncbi:stage V sporulation protein E [Dehalobacterium formicoaceticum]|uniref:Stage V sporulation protein E n=1 Tax=Dehalobacterium formicoaceticum TaxID=51515 RepID=A0ABT1Y3I3_9FIRM|nr:stage V sporulation protein E [Dehalobacterium formicoaceticum]MCR6544479.1 stage V sporulation protein E [Dehalobacterium formicoaceticum]
MALKKKSPDFLIFLSVLLLLGIGIIMVFSSSQYVAYYQTYDPGLKTGDAFVFLRRQLFNALLGIIAMVFVMKINYQKLKIFAKPGIIISFILLAVILIKGVGIEINGATRWLGVGPFQIQPSEIFKLALVLFLAKYLSERQHLMKSFKEGLLLPLALMGGACLLIMKQPDLGTAMTIAGTTIVMLWAAGARKSHLAMLVAAGLVLVVAAIVLEPYRMARIFAFLDPWQDPQDTGFQTVQSLLAIGSGGLAGVGLGYGRAKMFYLPERHTDFIFAVIAEELGFIGGTAVILLFLLFVWRGLKVAVSSPESFGSLLAVGVTSMVGIQAIINLGVVTGSLPVTGITLPFISYGGSSLLFSLAGVGLLLNVSRYAGSDR